MVEKVKSVGAEYERLTLGDFNAFPDRYIAVQDPWAMEYIPAQIPVAARALSDRTTGTDSSEVRIGRSIRGSPARPVEIRILNPKLVRARIYKLNVSTDVIGTVIAGPGQ